MTADREAPKFRKNRAGRYTSVDGRWILVRSNQDGTWDLYEDPTGSGTAVPAGKRGNWGVMKHAVQWLVQHNDGVGAISEKVDTDG